jgi:hypothetical protein
VKPVLSGRWANQSAAGKEEISERAMMSGSGVGHLTGLAMREVRLVTVLIVT